MESAALTERSFDGQEKIVNPFWTATINKTDSNEAIALFDPNQLAMITNFERSLRLKSSSDETILAHYRDLLTILDIPPLCHFDPMVAFLCKTKSKQTSIICIAQHKDWKSKPKECTYFNPLSQSYYSYAIFDSIIPITIAQLETLSNTMNKIIHTKKEHPTEDIMLLEQKTKKTEIDETAEASEVKKYIQLYWMLDSDFVYCCPKTSLYSAYWRCLCSQNITQSKSTETIIPIQGKMTFDDSWSMAASSIAVHDKSIARETKILVEEKPQNIEEKPQNIIAKLTTSISNAYKRRNRKINPFFYSE